MIKCYNGTTTECSNGICSSDTDIVYITASGQKDYDIATKFKSMLDALKVSNYSNIEYSLRKNKSASIHMAIQYNKIDLNEVLKQLKDKGFWR